MEIPAIAKGHKAECRRYYRGLQASFTPEQYMLWNSGLAEGLVTLASSIPPGSLVAVYHAREREADLAPLFHLPLRFAFPRVLDREGIMEFLSVEKVEKESFVLDNFGIMEPVHHHPRVSAAEVHTAFVPLLAFDGEGKRLGQGKGFYDRFLAEFRGQRIGVGFEWQYSQKTLPVDAHDQSLHAVVTEHGVRRF
jgi:5-formyltetrahydrofolate cyclo-ligase